MRLSADLAKATADRDAHADRCVELARRVTELEQRPGIIDPNAAAPCSRLDEFFDGELVAAAAEAFQSHLAICKRCQDLLHGRMQERVAVATSRCCDNLVAYLDGELSAAEAATFHAHLRGCEQCGAMLPLSTLTPERGQ